MGLELNLDGLIGPSHNYAGLATGNTASQAHAGQTANPRQAALQGLDKMWALHQLGIPQAVIPPQQRPATDMLYQLGFRGNEQAVIARAAATEPGLLANVYSASAMWAANAATVTPSCDSSDRKLHVSAANLISHLHRSIEAQSHQHFFSFACQNPEIFNLHTPLPAQLAFADEGAANHLRLAPEAAAPGLHLLVATHPLHPPQRYPGRQQAAASEALQRRHRLSPINSRVIYQEPKAIDAGAFHNDVVCASHLNLLLVHQDAWWDQHSVYEWLEKHWPEQAVPLIIEEISRDQLSLAEAVSTYLFNSQLVSLASGGMALIAPQECQENSRAFAVIQQLLAGDNPIREVHFFDLRQSMHNGGGPACLRLRMELSDTEFSLLPASLMLNESLYRQLGNWIRLHYRDRLSADDLADPNLVTENLAALEALTDILDLGIYYPFQRLP